MFIQENPGVCIREIADDLGVTRNAATYHVRVLKKRKKITSKRQGRRVLHFPAGMQNPAEKAALGLVRRPSVRPILEAMLRDPSVSWRSLARKMDISAHAVRWHVKRLTREGLIHVISRNDGSAHDVHVHPEVRSILGWPDDEHSVPSPYVSDFESWGAHSLGGDVRSDGMSDVR